LEDHAQEKILQGKEGRFEDGSSRGDDNNRQPIEGMTTMRSRAMINGLAVSANMLAGSPVLAATAEPLDASCRLEGRNMAVCWLERVTPPTSPNWTLRACGAVAGCMRRSNPPADRDGWPADMIRG
jgi:hypothetical protein